MIWLTTQDGVQEHSCYFEIRAIDLQRTESGTQGCIRGLLGDGQSEVWGEVELGTRPQAQILPVWNEDGQIETLDEAIDEDQLKQQLVTAVQGLFARFGALTALAGSPAPAAEVAEKIKSGPRLAA